jgi:hypothetical protein
MTAQLTVQLMLFPCVRVECRVECYAIRIITVHVRAGFGYV